jgi:hypothetical protein
MIYKKESRRHPRARVRLPVRIRWRDAFGLRSEDAETLDLSRNGVLVPGNESWSDHTRFWVTLPYDAKDATGLQPEVLATRRCICNFPAPVFAPNLTSAARARDSLSRCQSPFGATAPTPPNLQ